MWANLAVSRAYPRGFQALFQSFDSGSKHHEQPFQAVRSDPHGPRRLAARADCPGHLDRFVPLGRPFLARPDLPKKRLCPGNLATGSLGTPDVLSLPMDLAQSRSLSKARGSAPGQPSGRRNGRQGTRGSEGFKPTVAFGIGCRQARQIEGQPRTAAAGL